MLNHSSNLLGTELLRGGLHGLSTGISNVINGGNFSSGLISGTLASWNTSLAHFLGANKFLGTTISMATGALSESITGGNWIDGAKNAMMSALLNQYGDDDIYAEKWLPGIEVIGHRIGKTSSIIHTGLEIAGFIPAIGTAASIIDALYHGIEGDYSSALLSAAAIIPGGGIVVRGGKYARWAVDGFESFNAFKKAMKSAGSGYAWHHIVEQTPANLKKFGPQMIHNKNNLIKLPHGKGTIHARISGFYSSKKGISGDMRVRDWLSSKSFEEQYEFGINKLKSFGWTP